MPHPHHEWFERTSEEIASDYEKHREVARTDPQQSGHVAEATWANTLATWLPPGYSVGARKYIVPEQGGDVFETDLVVFNRAYPEPLRRRTHVLVGGVAAAFSVKLTLDAAGIDDGVSRAKRLKAGLKARAGTPRAELVPPFPVGVLALSHGWKSPGSEPRRNVRDRLASSALEHPLLALDYLCVADLATWCMRRMLYLPPSVAAGVPGHTDEQVREGFVMTSFMEMNQPGQPVSPIAVLVAELWGRLANIDPALQPLADTFRLTDTLGAGQGFQRWWNLSDVYTDDVRRQLPMRSNTSKDWTFSIFD